MDPIIWALGATILVSLISLVGVVTFLVKQKVLDKMLFLLVGLSAGAMLGGAFFHLIPEAVGKLDIMAVGLYIIVGFSIFFLIERILHWHHCHKAGGKCDVHMFTYMNLIGDGVHNFIDGLVIAGAFVADVNLGIATTIAVILHEIPQEISDFAVLVYGGFSRIKALAYNLLSALTAVIGAIAGIFLSTYAGSFSSFLLPFAAGGFIYIAASDLIPELHREPDLKKAMQAFAFFLAGIALMLATKIVFKE